MLDRLLHFVTGSPAFQFLRSVTPFDLLPDADLERLADALAIEYHPRGSTVLVQGQSAVKDVYVVVKGALHAHDDAAGPGGAPRAVGLGETLGGACILSNGGVAQFTVRASEDTFLYGVPGPLFLEACRRHPAFRERFVGEPAPVAPERGAPGLHQRWLLSGPDADAVGFTRTVGALCDRGLEWCGPDEAIRDVARRMGARRRPAVLVRGPAGAAAVGGIVTERDLVERAVAGGLPPESPIAAVMRPAGAVIPEGAPLADALEVMVASGSRALPVAGPAGEIVGLLTGEDVLGAHGGAPLDYLRDLAGTRLRKDLAERRARLPRLVRGLLLDGARTDSVTWLISAVSDATLRRVLDLALAELGPAPAPFVFLALGSEGRREQTLVTDQDNAIVYADAPGREAEAADWFARLGERVCTWLNEVGVEYCEGDVMASNPQWCQPLSAWREYFRRWVELPVPDAVLNSSIFFDFREVHGDAALGAELRAHVGRLLGKRPGMFFHLLAQAVVDRELPRGFMGRLSVETRGDREDVFDIKVPIAAICELTRLHGLWHGVPATSTLERLQRLAQVKEMDARTCLDLRHAYAFLMQLRLARQVAAVGERGAPADNLVSTAEISTLERKFLEEAFALVARVQQSARRKFLRSA
jgi:CBS domain-containing protein